MASPVGLEACTKEMLRLRMITLLTLTRFRLMPTSEAVEPRPRIEVLEPTITSTLPVMVPLTCTILGEEPLTALSRAERVLTVVVGPPAPPVVPAPKPTRG